jgi:Zn finger protein HypA/HybF involved in hydrogenase expression
MTVGVLKNWVWCEDCLEWKDAGDEVSLRDIEEDSFGKDVMTFECDKCKNENKNTIISSVTKPRG